MQTNNEQTDFLRSFALLAALYPNAKLTEASGAAYWELLKDLPKHAIDVAMKGAPSRSPEFFPTAQILRIAAVEAKSRYDAQDKQLELNRLLPGKVEELPEKARDDFFEACDKALANDLGSSRLPSRAREILARVAASDPDPEVRKEARSELD